MTSPSLCRRLRLAGLHRGNPPRRARHHRARNLHTLRLQTAFKLIMRLICRSFFALTFSAAILTGSGHGEPNPARMECTQRIGVSGSIDLRTLDGPLRDKLAPGQVVLSFDDGPAGKSTRAVLDVLDAHCTKAVFFLRGDAAAMATGLVSEIAARGHSVGSHGFDHDSLADMPLPRAVENINRGRMAVDVSLPSATVMFRYPFLARSARLDRSIESLGLISVDVDADGQDWTGNMPADRVARILNQLDSKDRKGVILLHDPFPKSAETTDLLLKELHKNGYTVLFLYAGDAR
jgi:peptidoglycan-N-acetylglucosamine deacetylase